MDQTPPTQSSPTSQPPVDLSPIAEPQPNFPQPATLPTPPVPEKPKSKNNLLLIVTLSVLLLIAISIAGFFAFQTQKLTKELAQLQVQVQITPTPSPAESPAQKGTADWKTYEVLDGVTNKSEGIEYKLPPETKPPVWVNAGRYYQAATLPGNTLIGVFLVGKNQGYQYSYEEFINQVITKNKLSTKPNKIGNLSALEFSGKIENPIFNVLILGVGKDGFRGIVAKIDNDKSLYLLHYQTESTPPQPTDFVSDEKTFDQILSTFKFLENNQATYQCSTNGWVNCIPILTEEAKRGCTPEAIEWYKANCPNFQGVAQ